MTRTSPPLLAPSILSADFSRLAEEIREVEAAGADWIHVDVMDGHFVPNLTIGPVVVSAIKPHTTLPLDCHLMVSEPEKWVEGFAKAGAATITVHVEATTRLAELLAQIRGLGCRAGVSLNPDTPVSAVVPFLDQVDLVLVMSVHPGFGGQKYIAGSEQKITELVKQRALLRARDPALGQFLIEIDGGIGTHNVAIPVLAGVDVIVAGAAIFGQKDRRQAIDDFRKACT